MLSVVRISPRPHLKCGEYDLDAFAVELNDEDLDFRFELGRGYMIYWALPAAHGDRLRLALVDCAVMEIDEPTIEADPFVFDFPRIEWSGELGTLHDGSMVTRVVVEVSVEPPTYRCEVNLRSATGETQTKLFSWRQ